MYVCMYVCMFVCVYGGYESLKYESKSVWSVR